jgi:hypothetical protein
MRIADLMGGTGVQGKTGERRGGSIDPAGNHAGKSRDPEDIARCGIDATCLLQDKLRRTLKLGGATVSSSIMNAFTATPQKFSRSKVLVALIINYLDNHGTWSAIFLSFTYSYHSHKIDWCSCRPKNHSSDSACVRP